MSGTYLALESYRGLARLGFCPSFHTSDSNIARRMHTGNAFCPIISPIPETQMPTCVYEGLRVDLARP
jgi:hypothetical protein